MSNELAIQSYLRSGKTHDDLTAELGVKVMRHDTLPLAILNYCQINSPKLHPIVREARALVLHAETHELIARSFSRFFNWGEVPGEMDAFDFSDFSVQTKEDGSLCLLYFFDGRWHANTRGSFATDKINGHAVTWRQAFCKALGIEEIEHLYGQLDEAYCYVCEFCSPYNKVVRSYSAPQMFLLSAFCEHEELSPELADILARESLVKLHRPAVHHFKSIEEIQAFLTAQSEADPTFEGIVIRDRANRRWKVKNPTYLALHKLKGEGDNLYHPKHLLPFVLKNDEDELLTYFPEVEEAFRDCQAKVAISYESLRSVWLEHWQIESQKDFALAIIGKTPFTGLLFDVRKRHGKAQTEADLQAAWSGAADVILKNIFPREVLS